MSINGIPAAAKSDNSPILATARQAIDAWEALDPLSEPGYLAECRAIKAVRRVARSATGVNHVVASITHGGALYTTQRRDLCPNLPHGWRTAEYEFIQKTSMAGMVLSG